jgi:tetratricopeptide (TPR) repeat protein
MKLPSTVLVCLLIGMACDTEQPDVDAAATAPAQASATAEATPAAGDPPAKASDEKDSSPDAITPDTGKTPKQPPPKPDAATAKKNAAAFSAALAAGRTAVKAGSHDEALARFDEALKLDPNHPGALGERGWAAFKKGDLVEARRSTERALGHVKSDKRRGALLYNLGRIYEAEGDVEKAIDQYALSLAARPNDTVRERRAGLGAKRPEPPAPPPPGDSAAGLEKLGQRIIDEDFYCEDAVDCGCESIQVVESPDPEAHVQAAAVLSCGAFVSGMGEENNAILAVRTSTRGWQDVARIADGSMPGISYISNEYDLLALKFEQLFSGGDPELRVRIRERNNDGDYASNLLEFDDTIREWVCFRAGEVSRCAWSIVEHRGGTEVMMDDGTEPVLDEFDSLGVTQSEYALSYPGDAIVSREKSGKTTKVTLAELMAPDSVHIAATIH